MRGTVHVGWGSNVADTLARGRGVPGAATVLVSSDDLSVGRLSPLRDLGDWVAMRRASWAGLQLEHADEGGIFETKHVLRSPRRLARASRVVVWCGRDLGDHLLLAFVPQLLRLLGGDPRKLHLVEFDDRTRGLRLTEIARAARPRPLGDDELAYLDQVWAAVTAASPVALLAVLAEPEPPLPQTRRVLRRLLSVYPDATTGLNLFDRLLLECAREHGPSASRIVGHTLVAAWELEHAIGDGTLFDRLHRMAAAAHPAVLLESEDTTRMSRTLVRLTELGERLLRGEASFLALNGIDEWIGGVHLDSASGGVWFSEGSTLVQGSCGIDAPRA